MSQINQTTDSSFVLIDKLQRDHVLTRSEWEHLFADDDPALLEELMKRGKALARKTYGNQVYTRGLIEFTNYCKNDCYYCGIRRSNKNVERYRLTEDQILECCQDGHDLGFRTFVLQGGEDMTYSDEDICRIVRRIKAEQPDCAVTLSLGERSRSSYQKFYEAGADRYLLRHETADPEHYALLHPEEMSLENRKECLRTLKEIGYQVGSGFMVGSPGQTSATLAEDMLFLTDLQPHMIGIGPYVPHHDTPFAEAAQGTVKETLKCISLLRLAFPEALIPATTSLGTIDPNGREKGINAGANVVMPNLSPVSVRKKYELYDNKICTGEESAQCRGCLAGRMDRIGYELAVSRGDHPSRAQQAPDTTQPIETIRPGGCDSCVSLGEDIKEALTDLAKAGREQATDSQGAGANRKGVN